MLDPILAALFWIHCNLSWLNLENSIKVNYSNPTITDKTIGHKYRSVMGKGTD